MKETYIICKKDFKANNGNIFKKLNRYKIDDIFTTTFTTTWHPSTPQSERILVPSICYVINGKEYAEYFIKEYFHTIKEERKEKLEKINENEND